MSDNCLFCRLAAGEIPSDKMKESEHALAFRDVQPVAPEHILIIPKKHIASLGDLDTTTAEGAAVWAEMARMAQELGEGHPNGWRLVTNTGDEGGQSVHHLHLHFLAGRQFSWPPG